MTDTPKIKALVTDKMHAHDTSVKTLLELAKDPHEVCSPEMIVDLADALERTQAVVEAAQHYNASYEASDEYGMRCALVDVRRGVRTLAALDAPPEGDG